MSDAKILLTTSFPKPETVRNDIAKDGFAIYDGAIDLGALGEMKAFWSEYFQRGRPRRRVIRGSLRLGEENFNGYTDDRQNCLYRDIDFLWNKPTHAITRQVGEEIHRVRNLAQDFERDLGFEYRDDCYGIYISTSCYPAGSGWMRGHIDGHKDKPILQYMLPITYKGIDYKEGGLYVTSPDGKKIDVDGLMKPGSIVFFDGRLKHGVDTINQTIGRNGSNGGAMPGRIASFAITTFFRTRKELPDLMRRVEDTYWSMQARLARFRGRTTTDEY